MRARFKWRWDEELGGEDLESIAAQRRSRRLLWAFLLLFAAVAALFYWQQARRLRLQEQAIEEDVSASYRLWHRALNAGDLELFLFQLSNQDAPWQNGQRELFLQRRLLDRPELGLERLASQDSAEIVKVTLAPDWQSATVLADYAYRPVDGEAESPLSNGDSVLPLQLRHAHFYRRHGERWLLSPGDEEFWGPQQRLQLAGLTVIYPRRDTQIVTRIGQDLANDLRRLCNAVPRTTAENGATGNGAAGNGAACLDRLQITVRFERDAQLLLSLRDSFTPVFRGGDFVLPAPTLVGLPRDAAAYERLYEGYTTRILNALRQNLTPPLPLPREALQLLCFPRQGRALQLFRYEPASDHWTAELTDHSFRFLMPGPQGDGVIVQAFTRGAEATRLRLLWWRDGHRQLIYDQEMQEQTRRPAGWSASDHPHLLLQGFSSAETSAQHRWLNLDDCDAGGCAVVDLPGYTVWSPDGRHSLVLEGQALWRGDALGRPRVQLGVGLSPFWLDDETYGYVRYDREAGAPSMHVATSNVAHDLPQIVMPVTQLAQLLDETNPPLLFVNYVGVNPADKDLLLLSATTVGSATAKYNIFSLRLSTGHAQLLQQFERLPSGYPSLLTPAGYPPFRLSPDGRWLLVTLLAGASPTTWSFHLYDLQRQQALELNAYYPEYPAQFPFYDWTPDGRWLVVVEDGYLRLVAPGHDYQKLVTHRLDDCFYVAWTS